MKGDTTKRLSRLTAILTQLQSKRIVTARDLAEKHHVNVRTIYRDIQALEESGVPIITEEGKGYSIMEDYRVPPVMFTEREAFALVTAEHIIATQKDSSIRDEFKSAVDKIRAVLKKHSRKKTEIVESSIYVGKNVTGETTSDSLIDVQMAIAMRNTISIHYRAENGMVSQRDIAPYMLYHSEKDNWIVCAWCKSRNEFRSFRVDRIVSYNILRIIFMPDKKAFNKYIKENFLN